MRDCWVSYRNRRYRLRQGETTLGRSPYCSIVLEGKLASRHHAALLFTEGRLEIQDLRSRNGTLVNGVPVTAVRRLEVGDRISIGEEVLMILSEAPARGSAERTVDMGGGYRVPHTDRPLPERQEETLNRDPEED